MKNPIPNPEQFYTQRAERFFARYGEEIATISRLLQIRLEQLALAYTLEHKLPRQAVAVFTRVKTLDSFIKKLRKKGWPDFYYPTEVATDLVGARVVCWFLDDVYGILAFVRSSRQISIRKGSLEDYIKKPKETGYRSIHLLADLAYDRVAERGSKRIVTTDKMVCEIQLRTKLQDAWGEFTHEIHYKIPERFEDDYEVLVAEIANRLCSEDKSALAIRNILQKKVEKKKHEGFRPK